MHRNGGKNPKRHAPRQRTKGAGPTLPCKHVDCIHFRHPRHGRRKGRRRAESRRRGDVCQWLWRMGLGAEVGRRRTTCGGGTRRPHLRTLGARRGVRHLERHGHRRHRFGPEHHAHGRVGRPGFEGRRRLDPDRVTQPQTVERPQTLECRGRVFVRGGRRPCAGTGPGRRDLRRGRCHGHHHPRRQLAGASCRARSRPGVGRCRGHSWRGIESGGRRRELVGRRGRADAS